VKFLHASELKLAPQVEIPIVLELKESVRINSNRIFLEDIAVCTGSTAICEESYGVEIVSLNASGKTYYLNPTQIKRAMIQEWPQMSLEFKGAKRVQVKLVGKKIDKDEILEKLTSILSKISPSIDNIKVDVISLQVPSNLKTFGQSYQISFPELSNSSQSSVDYLLENFSGTKRLRVEYAFSGRDEGVIKNFVIMAKMEIKAYLPTAKMNLKRGSKLSLNDFSDKWIRIKKAISIYVRNIQMKEGYSLKTNIKVGHPLLVESIALPTVVKRGQKVRLTVKRGHLNIVTQVKAMKSASIGDYVEVMSSKTGKRFKARVVNENSVVLY
jgi:flagella basal body P-ring formation protein FlgA